MGGLVIPAIFVVLLWWASTGVLLRLNLSSRRFDRASMWVLSVAVVGALVALVFVREMETPAGAALAFICATVCWAWQEMSYYTDTVTGIHRNPCDAYCSGWARFRSALGTSIYHELAIVAGGGVLWAMTYASPNQTVFFTYLIFWIMRWSAKLNVFLGVRNVNVDWLPEHLQYLHTYMPGRKLNALLPISVIGGGATAAVLAHNSVVAISPYEQWHFAIMATLLALAVIEHLFLVLPLDDARLWRWAQPSGRA